MLTPSSHGPHADLLQMLSICLSHHHSRWGGCIPKCPEVGRTAALSRELHEEKKKKWSGELQAPKFVPNGLYFRQPIWCKGVLNGSDQCLKWKPEEVRDIHGSYTTADKCNRDSKFARNKTNKNNFLFWRCHILPSQSMVLLVAANFKR